MKLTAQAERIRDEQVQQANALYLSLFEQWDLAALARLEEHAAWYTSTEIEVPRPLSTYLDEMRSSRDRGELTD